VAAGAETSWQWDGRVATVEGTLMTCERLSTASDGPMVIRVKFERNEGAGPSGMAEAAFTNPPAAPVVITVR
jgi:hypothetical protein